MRRALCVGRAGVVSLALSGCIGREIDVLGEDPTRGAPPGSVAPVPEAMALPRPVSPASTAVVTARTPELRWALPEGLTGACVEVCRTRVCSELVDRACVEGTRWQVSETLAPGPVYWRLRASERSPASATWQFVVARSAAAGGGGAGGLDVNADGYADLLLEAPSTSGRLAVLYRGSSAGLDTQLPQHLVPPRAATSLRPLRLARVGDTNGDGFGDALVVARSEAGDGALQLLWYPGALSGLSHELVDAVPTPAIAEAGCAASGVGDVDGDGYADVVVGADDAVLWYRGGPRGLSRAPSQTLAVHVDGYRSGCVLAGVGDVDGDRRPDLAVGSTRDLGDDGLLRVFLGTFHGFATVPAWTLAGVSGRRVTAGDLDGDGLSDLAAEARSPDRVRVFRAAQQGRGALELAGDGGSAFGASVSVVGDVNGDGYADLAVGAPQAFEGRGAVYLYEGFRGGVFSVPTRSYAGTAREGATGAAVFGGGDFDGDGFADVVIGTPGQEIAEAHYGSITIDRPLVTRVEGFADPDESAGGFAADNAVARVPQVAMQCVPYAGGFGCVRFPLDR